MNAKETVTEITLTYPIKVGDEALTILRIRRPKAKDFREIGNMDKPFDAMLDFAASLADIAPSAIDQLDVDDVPKVIEVVSGFLGKFPEIGKKS